MAPLDLDVAPAHMTPDGPPPMVPGRVYLDRKLRLSLPQLLWLEQEMSTLEGLERAAIQVLPDGSVAVDVPVDKEAQAREFLELSGQLTSGVGRNG
jgi:hypothetical protein